VKQVTGANIICLSSIDWAFNRQNPQEVASAFAEMGNRVLFIENTGVRRVGLRDASRLWSRVGNWRRARHGVTSVANRIDVHSPLLIPLPYSRLAGFANIRLLLRVIRHWRGRETARPLVFITFLPTPLALSLIRSLDPDFVVYYCIDRLGESSPGARKLHDFEPTLIVQSDLVLLTAEELRSPAMAEARVEMLPSGVRFRDFENARREHAPAPPLFDGLRGPVAGFVGSIRDQTDVALLEQTVALAPELNFVFVGPVMTNVSRLAAQPNVRMSGPVPHHEVMHYMAHFDAGILPYVIDDYTTGIMPAKLKEYLAAGLPVVSTRLPGVCRFADRHPGVIDFASDAESFTAALRAAVANNCPEAVERRVAVARHYDWPEQLARVSETIAEMMGSAHLSS
jgi:glycosyltransferase involved in cell wall biosynthesis